MELNIKLIGAFLVCLGLAHVIFPKYFNWANELRNLSLINRQIMYVHTFFIALILLLMGLLCLTSANELIKTTLGNKLTLGLGIFWMIRLGIQFLGYSTKLWKGKRFETVIHILFSLSWVYLSVTFFYIYFTYRP
jgi:hypothetical protein